MFKNGICKSFLHPNKTELIEHIEDLHRFIQHHLGFVNSHIFNLFTSTSFQDFVPVQIQEEISRIGVNVAFETIFKRDFSTKSTPALKAYFNQCQQYSLLNQYRYRGVCLQYEQIKCDKTLTIDPLLRHDRRLKKIHEIKRFNKLIIGLGLKDQFLTHLIDFGAGRGDLSASLALQYKIPVVGVDASNYIVCHAAKNAAAIKHLCQNDFYRHKTMFIDETTQLTNLIGPDSGTMRAALIGLHTCGNLAANSLRIFAADEEFRLLCNVSCCYKLLTERFLNDSLMDRSVTAGFPLCTVLNRRTAELGRRARCIASYNVERIDEKGQLTSTNVFYRALLELLLFPNLHNINGRIKYRATDFVDYTRHVLARFRFKCDISDAELIEFYKFHETKFMDLQLYYMLRQLIGPAIEALILLDRVLFLIEYQCTNTFLVRLFDPIISPRCYAIVSFKN